MLAAAQETWSELARQRAGSTARFDPAALADLPEPARRWFARVLPPGCPLVDAIELEMTGEIALRGRWLPFRATQILRAGVGFVWSPTVGGRLMRFAGADILGPNGARMEFRLHGVVPVVRATGPDIARSAAGRLAAETVAWLPHALAPPRCDRWRPVDATRAVVTVDAAGTPVDVEVTIDRVGRLREMQLLRWSSDSTPPTHRPFGGRIDSEYTTTDGAQIAGSGSVGWEWGTSAQEEGVFFRYRLTDARPLGSG